MSNGNSGFGSKVIGHEAYEQAVRNEAGGGNVFGTRVRGAITGSGPTNDAKRVSEFGVGVIDGAHASDAQGNKGDTVSVEDLRNILAENPTFFDSLYEAELAREDGPRDDALGIFYEVERGIKGQMRADVMSEIRGMLGQNSIDAEALANQASVRREAQDQMLKRTEENRLLADADRVKALVERNDNVKRVQEQQDSGGIAVQVGLSTESQEARIAADRGVALPGAEHATGTVSGGTPAKPDGDTNVETQQPGERLGVPKADNTVASGGSSSNGTRPATGAASTDDADAKAARKAKASEFTAGADYPKDKLEADLRKALGDEKVDAVKGSGSNGNVVKDDLVTLAVASIEEGTADVNRSGYIVASS